MSGVGLVLGGGGLTAAAYHFGALLALRLATGWDPARSRVVVGTSSGAAVAALVRADRLSVDSLVGEAPDHGALTEQLNGTIYRRPRRLRIRSAAPYTTEGLEAWMRDALGDLADAWPAEPTVVVACRVKGKRRVAFGTEGSPDVGLARAVAASSAAPVLFAPVVIDGVAYVDGGVISGTNADLVLGCPEPLDLVLVLAPMASPRRRPKARLYETFFDRLGESALSTELDAVRRAWPHCDLLVLRPDEATMAATRPNPLDAAAALPAFLSTLHSMRTTLASPEVWPVLERRLA